MSFTFEEEDEALKEAKRIEERSKKEDFVNYHISYEN
jgi:hypothetical protein